MPRRDVDKLQEEIEELFADLWQVPRFTGLRHGFRPNVDCFHTDDPHALTVVVELPGVDPQSVQVVVGERVLVDRGRAHAPEGRRAASTSRWRSRSGRSSARSGSPRTSTRRSARATLRARRADDRAARRRRAAAAGPRHDRGLARARHDRRRRSRRRSSSDQALDFPAALPVLPLKETVVFPQSMSPLAIGQERSVRLIDDVVSGDRLLALVTARDASVEAPGWDDLYEVGTVALVHKMIKVPDGTLRILVQGLERVKLANRLDADPYLARRVRRAAGRR